MKPRVAIPIPTSTDRAYNEQNWPAYARCLEACGAEPVPFPLDLPARQAKILALGCVAVCLTGSPADIDPLQYGHERDSASAPADPAREHIDHLLLEEVFNARKPLLAICFGLQSLNVFQGGSLVQDLAPLPVNHAAGASVGVAHMVSVASGSLLASLSESEATAGIDGMRIPANSSHHQAVGLAGKGLRVTARCPQDGVAEALELEDAGEHAFLLGVQWHPERTFSSPISRALFEGFVAAARQRNR